MKPRHITYIIWIVITILSIFCWITPKGGFKIGNWTLRWPTLAEVIGTDDEDNEHRFSDTTWMVQIDDYLTLEYLKEDTHFTPSPKREVQPLQPKYYLFDSIPQPTTPEPSSTPTAKRDSTPIHKTTAQTNTPVVSSTKKTTPTPADIQEKDTRTYLAAFYQALDSAHIKPIRVVHYGDSQIEEDRITDILRERWQKKYGGGGVGLLPLHQTVATRSIRQWTTINDQRQTTKGGPKRYLIYGPRSRRQDNNDYGMMGQVAVMDNSLVTNSQEIVMHVEPANKKEKPHRFFNQVRIFSNNIGAQIIAHNTTINPSSHNRNLFYLPDSTTQCDIHLRGQGKVYGVSLETSTGVMVDNIPMRGCSGTIFTHLNSTSLVNYFHDTNTRLIIMQYGGNMIPYTKDRSSINKYVQNIRRQVRHMRACAPYASLLFVGPSDMSTRIDGEMATYPMIPYLDQQLQKMAQEEGIAYWSMYNAMGGEDSMISWVEKGFAGHDYVHFTRAGANKIGRMLGDWIDSYKR